MIFVQTPCTQSQDCVVEHIPGSLWRSWHNLVILGAKGGLVHERINTMILLKVRIYQCSCNLVRQGSMRYLRGSQHTCEERRSFCTTFLRLRVRLMQEASPIEQTSQEDDARSRACDSISIRGFNHKEASYLDSQRQSAQQTMQPCHR